LKILVFIKEVEDIKVPLEHDESTGRLKTDWNVPMFNPEDGAAVEAALRMKERLPETHITLIHLGPVPGERFIREGLALGCNEGFRIWDEACPGGSVSGDLDKLHAQGKALIFARVAKILSFDLIFTGTKSQDTGSGQLGVLLASALQVPCATRVIALRNGRDGKIAATRILAQGYQEHVECPTPLVVTWAAEEEPNRYASFPALLDATEKEIPCLDLTDIGLPGQSIQQVDSCLAFGPLHFPESRLKPVPAPDSSLPAFERREKLREGSMAKREGRIVRGEENSVVEEIFQTLLREGWLDHLRKRG
jgi:electron transfer flavoprotein beta subunit